MLSKITDPIIQATSKFLRATGQGMDKIGKAIELHGYTERCKFSLCIYAFFCVGGGIFLNVYQTMKNMTFHRSVLV